MLNHETSKIDQNQSGKILDCLERCVHCRGLDNESCNTYDRTEDSGARAGLAGTVDGDDTRGRGGSDRDIGGSSGRATLDRCSWTAAKTGGARDDGGRRRNTSDRRHNNTAGVGDRCHTGAGDGGRGRDARNVDTGERHSAVGGRSRSGLSAGNLGRVRATHDDWSRRGYADGTGAGWKKVSLAWLALS